MRKPIVEFLGWERSALELVGERLLKMNEDEPENFRRATVVVPTAESGRRLKEWMAQEAKRPLLMPRMTLAGQLIQTRGEHVAGEAETLVAWVETLTENPPHETWPNLFLQAVPERHLQTWALSTADRLMQLQLQLEQYELTIDELLRRLGNGANFDDSNKDLAARWKQVEAVEKAHWSDLQDIFNQVDQRLVSWGKTPGWMARAESMKKPVQAQNGPVIVACLPELSPQVQHYLQRLETASPGRVRIWVNGPKKDPKGFDIENFGRLIVNEWKKNNFPTDLLNDEQIKVTLSARGLARAAVEALSAAKTNNDVVLGVCDASFTPALVTELAEHGWQVHLPEGRSAEHTDLAALPGLLASACDAPLSMSAMEPLLRSVAMQRMWSGKLQAYDFCCLLDKLQQRYFADSVPYLLNLLNVNTPLPGLRQAVGRLPGSTDEPGEAQVNEREVIELEKMRSASFYQYAEWVVGFVEQCRKDIARGLQIFAEALRRAYSGHALQPVARACCEQVEKMVAFLQWHPLKPQEVWPLLRHMIAQHSTALQDSARNETQIDALGWRELPFACGSQIIITGLHEGCVPETLPVDPFLPDSLREFLGLPCMAMREARDNFLLATLLHRENVKVNIVISQLSADGSGTPVAPSSLLYHCPDEALASRVKDKLFEEIKPEETEKYAEWTLDVLKAQPREDGMESVEMIAPPGWVNPFAKPEHCFSPSEINAFLACPLRFWMKYALGISTWDEYKGDNKVEMTPAEYGTLMHNVLEDVARRYPRKELISDEADVLEFAVQKLHERRDERFGKSHLLPTTLRQIGHIRTCLEAFVKWHCQELNAGWVCYDCEHKVKEWPFALPDGTTARVSMRADRIDYMPERKAWRIVDYKTHSDKPIKKHLTGISARKLACGDAPLRGDDSFEALMSGAGFELYNGNKYWRDVQLPMYAAWLSEAMQCELPEVGYLNLPRAGHDNEGYNCMTELTDDALESALQWAGSAIMLMRAGRCLYSAESLGLSAPGASPEDDAQVDPRNLFVNLRNII